jgi:hypothetical protein
VVRITMQKLLEGEFGLGRVLKIVLLDLTDGKQSIEAVAAAGIFAAQKLVLPDG